MQSPPDIKYKLRLFEIKFHSPKYPNTLYLDKDGVLNKAIKRFNKISSPRKKQEIFIKKDLIDIFLFSKNKKFNLVVITNQPDLSRTLISKKFLQLNFKKIRKKLPICYALICPHLKTANCNCRKPNSGLIDRFRFLYPANVQKEIFIGDQLTDELCSLKSNILFIKVIHSFSKLNLIKNKLRNC